MAHNRESDVIDLINRSIKINARVEVPHIICWCGAGEVAAMLDMPIEDITAEAERNPALEDLGGGMFAVWSGAGKPNNGA